MADFIVIKMKVARRQNRHSLRYFYRRKCKNVFKNVANSWAIWDATQTQILEVPSAQTCPHTVLAALKSHTHAQKQFSQRLIICFSSSQIASHNLVTGRKCHLYFSRLWLFILSSLLFPHSGPDQAGLVLLPKTSPFKNKRVLLSGWESVKIQKLQLGNGTFWHLVQERVIHRTISMSWGSEGPELRCSDICDILQINVPWGWRPQSLNQFSAFKSCSGLRWTLSRL